MDREKFNYITEDMSSLEDGGIKKACYIIREWKNSRDCPDSCAVTQEEYEEAINILVAFSYPKCDNKTTVEMINCVNGCDTSKYICAGEFRLSLKPKKPCPYYIDDPGE